MDTTLLRDRTAGRAIERTGQVHPARTTAAPIPAPDTDTTGPSAGREAIGPPPCLRGWRRDAGLSTSEVAQRLDVHPNTVLRWERRERAAGPGHVRALADLYGVPLRLVSDHFLGTGTAPDTSLPGRNLRPLRQSRRISAATLAEVVVVPQHTIYNWELGMARVPAKLAPTLAQALSLEVDELTHALRAPFAGRSVVRIDHPLRDLRRARGLSQVALAHRAQVALCVVKAWESGRHGSLRSLRRLALALDVPAPRLARHLGYPLPPELDPRNWRPGTFRHVLRLLREWSCLTQADLAGMCSVSPSTIRSWEAGRHRPSHEKTSRLEGLLRTPSSALWATVPQASPH